jgi:ParB/RepB/Spo0J family partition protein
MTTTYPLNQLIMLPHERIVPSERNPRRYFDQAKIEELTQSFTARGFCSSISHLLVRPVPGSDCYELVCGERRWRSYGTLLSAGKVQPEVPAMIQAMSDAEVLEYQLVENLQRSDLTPLEEADGFAAMLDLSGEDGKPLHTLKTLAAKVGRTERHLIDRLAIRKLRHTPAGEALESGDLPISHARLLARVPAGQLRDGLTKRVLKPIDGLAPMPYRQLERVIRDECMVELRGATFDPAAPELLPLRASLAGERLQGGSCNDCPFNTKNSEEDERGSKIFMCMNPECFREKTSRAHEHWMQSVTDPEKNRRALSVDEAEAVFDPSGRRLDWRSGYVELDAAPDEADLKRPAQNSDTWKKLIRGQGIEVVVAKDVTGKVHELVKHDAAIAAAALAGHDIFKRQVKEPEASTDELKSQSAAAKEEVKRRMEEAEAARVREQRISEAQFQALLTGARKAKVPEEFWKLALLVLVDVTDEHGDAHVVAERHNLLRDESCMAAPELRKYVAKLALPDQVAMVTELLFTFYQRPEARAEMLPHWAKAFGVDLKATRKQVDEQIKSESAAAKAAKEVEDGLKWLTERDYAEEFGWNSHGVCDAPDRCIVTLPGNVTAGVSAARSVKGWHVGWMVSSAKKRSGRIEPCENTATHYDTRALALRTGLLAIQSHLIQIVAPVAALDRIGVYLSRGAEPTGKGKSAGLSPKGRAQIVASLKKRWAKKGGAK